MTGYRVPHGARGRKAWQHHDDAFKEVTTRGVTVMSITRDFSPALPSTPIPPDTSNNNLPFGLTIVERQASAFISEQVVLATVSLQI
jgi:hypothetical protein